MSANHPKERQPDRQQLPDRGWHHHPSILVLPYQKNSKLDLIKPLDLMTIISQENRVWSVC